MEEVFKIDIDETGLSVIAKREANIKLASLDNRGPEYSILKEKYKDVINVAKAIDSTDPKSVFDIEFILDAINKLFNTGILSPLTLKYDEFFNDCDKDNLYHNSRYYDICIDLKTNNIYNNNAFNKYVRSMYYHQDGIELPCNRYIEKHNSKVYISKGGVITGEYIEKCIIRQEIVDKHSFTIQSVINIPVSIIIDDNDKFIYIVDHREPKLKALQEFYDVPINKDDNIANKHYNLRKYKKLNKK